MRRIIITDEIKMLVKEFSQEPFKGRSFDKTVKDALGEMKAEALTTWEFAPDANIDEAKIDAYLDLIIKDYELIIGADNGEILTYIKRFNQIIPPADISKKFYEKIVKAMRYDELRSKEFLALIKKINIKTCVYCHSIFTVVLDKDYYVNNVKDNAGYSLKGKVKNYLGLLELDHRYPKSKYPFLCTSFYNLYPTCSNCNRAKSDTDLDFQLYIGVEEIDKLNLVSFKMNDASVFKFYRSGDTNDLEINLIPRDEESDFFDSYNDLFSLSLIYENQKDIIAELIRKKRIYTKSYKNGLVDSFKTLFPNDDFLEHLLIGNYPSPDDMFKRPFSKFTQEIARSINLLGPPTKK